MNRRGFLKGLAAVVGGVALEEAIPFGRVWSFPKQIQLAKHPFDYSENLYRALKFHPDAFALISEPLCLWPTSLFQTLDYDPAFEAMRYQLASQLAPIYERRS